MKILTRRKRVTVPQFSHFYEWKNCQGAGFGFPCDKSGNIQEMNPAAQENYNKCVNGTFDVADKGIKDESYSYWEDATGQCNCGCTVILDSFTNTCECGKDYNMSGQRLAPRSQWGEETGESLEDILRI